MLKTSSFIQDAIIEEFRNSHLTSKSSPRIKRNKNNNKSPMIDNQRVKMNEDGLIMPKKLYNPCLESREVKDLNKEIKWNAKAGVNVLAGKSELAKAMDKRKWQIHEHEKKVEHESAKTDFQKVLEERAKKMDELEKPKNPVEKDGDSGHCSPEPESEFLKIKAHLKGVKVKPT